MSTNDDNKKLPTGITGLDAIFHGGIHTHNSEGNNKGIVMLARGQHGVNKIHLSMQICEGLYKSYKDIDKKVIRRDFFRKNRFAISYQMINKQNSKFKEKLLATFDNIINKCDIIKEKQEWEKRKNQCCGEYENWLIKHAPQFIKVNDNLSRESLREILKKYDLSEDSGRIISTEEWIDYYVNLYSEFIHKYTYHIEVGLKKAYNADNKNIPKILFISLNKDEMLLKNSYYDFYVQRLIRDIRMGVDPKLVAISLFILHSMLWTKVDTNSIISEILNQYGFPSITGEKPTIDNLTEFKNDINTGFIFYNGRTHGLHVRHQKGAEDNGGMLLCRLGIPDDYDVRIIGKDTLNGGDNSADGLTTFQEMMRELDKYKDKDTPQVAQNNNDKKPEVDFIMIDGLSRLNEEELLQCPLNALSDKLRSKSQVAIITADKKLMPSNISTDIVLDMEILQSERPDHQYTALKVSKCLYQKNAYGWHRYKMRNAGIEVIPSIHLQMGQRFLMDDIVTDAVLSINEYPYPFWLNENNDIYEDEKISDAKYKYKTSNKGGLTIEGCLKGKILNKEGVKNFCKKIIENNTNTHHILFVNLDNNRTEFNDCYINKIMEEIELKNVHLFNFQPGYIHTDEMLWAIDQQIKAIESESRNNNTEEDPMWLKTHYTHVSIVFGDLNYIHYAYPCLSAEPLLLPALATYTKKHHMTNYVYATMNDGMGGRSDEPINVEDTELHKKEIETIMQMSRITVPFE